MSSSDIKFAIGDPVWTKMKGYCPWPSRIAHHSESALKNTAADKSKAPKVHYLVYFFGSNNFAWMPEDTIKPYADFKEKNKGGSKNAQFKQGLKQIEEYIAAGGRATLGDFSSASPAIHQNNDVADSPSNAGGCDSVSNDASNNDANESLPTIDEELAVINSGGVAAKKASAGPSAKKMKNSSSTKDSQNDSSASISSPVQRDYSRTPFKSRKSTTKQAAGDDSSSEPITSPTKRVKTSNDDDGFGTSSLTSPTISSVTPKTTTTKSGIRNVILRASHYADTPLTETPQINMSLVSAKSKSIRPSNLKFGFIGLGLLGQRLLKNLLNSGHKVTIWNRTNSKCDKFGEAGAHRVASPADVVSASDITYICLSDPSASKEVVFGSFGVLTEMNERKGLVEMSSIDAETSSDISEAVISRGGRYLEAPPIIIGKKAAEDGELIIVAAGDKSLYEDCLSCFQAIAKQTFFLGHNIGRAARVNLIISMLYGSIVGVVAECMSLVERLDEVPMSEFKDILQLSSMNCPLISTTMDRIVDLKKGGTVGPIEVPLGHLQKNLKLALSMAEEYEHSCPITAITNEVFKASKRGGYSDYDAAAVYMRNRY